LIIVKLIGGLGNQMFQYALGQHLAMKNNSTLKLDIQGFKNYKLRNYDLNCFNIQENIARSKDLMCVSLPSDRFIHKIGKHLEVKLTGVQQIQYIKEQKSDFQPEILSLGDNIYLDGYWQSEKYFLDIENIIRNEFSIVNPLTSTSQNIAEQIKGCESVSIHVRRGDYVSNPVANQILGVCSLDYYNSAIQLMNKKLKCPHYFIFSDDLAYMETIFKDNSSVSIVSHNNLDKNNDFQDLYLMSLCQHQIIANSTFSWWAAWLNRNKYKIVIAPEKWFKDKSMNSNDLIPKNWITI